MMRFTIIALGASALAACSVSGPPQFSALGAGVPDGARVSLTPPEGGHAQEAQLDAALRQALSARGFQLVESGDYAIRYSLAERPAAVALARQNETGSVDTFSYSRSSLLLDRCEAQRLRVNVVAYDLAAGVPAYRGAADFNDCDFADAPFEEFAQEIALKMAAQ